MNLKTDQKIYRVYLEDGANANQVDAWRYFELRGKYGTIYPYSESHLAIQIKSSILANRVRRTKRYPLLQDADDVVVFKAPDSELKSFASMLKCSKLRHLSEQQREKLKLMGLKYKFKPGHTAIKRPKTPKV